MSATVTTWTVAYARRGSRAATDYAKVTAETEDEARVKAWALPGRLTVMSIKHTAGPRPIAMTALDDVKLDSSEPS